MSQPVDQALPSRRSIARGASWAVPALLLTSAAPTFAASAKQEAYSINGWVRTFFNEQGVSNTVKYDGNGYLTQAAFQVYSGSYGQKLNDNFEGQVELGLWVAKSTSDMKASDISQPTITFKIPKSQSTSNITVEGLATGWTKPRWTASPSDEENAYWHYTSTFTGTVKYDEAKERFYFPGKFDFRFTVDPSGKNVTTITPVVKRSVTITRHGEAKTEVFERPLDMCTVASQACSGRR